MRVLHVIADLADRHGGPTTAVRGMAEALAKRGHEVVVASTDYGAPATDRGDRESEENGVHYVARRSHRPAKLRASIGLGRWLQRSIPTFEIVHVHSMYLFHNWVCGRVCRTRAVPYLVRPHGTIQSPIWERRRRRKALAEWAFERTNLEAAAAVHCTSPQEVEAVKERFPRARPALVPLGVDLEFHTPGASESARETTILFLGRLTERKGVLELLDAFRRLASQREEARLVYAGPDDQGLGARLRERVIELGLENRVEFHGPVAGEEKRALLRRARCLVLPSARENFGLVVLEALANGTPVVCSEEVDVVAMFEGRSGTAVHVAPRNPEDLAHSVAHLLEGDAAQQARDAVRAASGFSWNRTAEALDRLYRDVLEGRAVA